MKVTEVKEMFYNTQGELEEMKYTKSMRRIDTSKPLTIQPQPPQLALPAIPSKPPKSTKDDDLKSLRSFGTSHSFKSNSNMSVGAQSLASKSTVVFYDYQDHSSFNWKVWAFLLAGGLLVYWVLAGAGADEVSLGVSEPSYHQTVGKSINVGESKIQTNESQENMIKLSQGKKTGSVDGERERVEVEARRLVSLLIDQLLIENQHKLLLSEFKKAIQARESVDPLVWEMFGQIVQGHNAIEVSGEGEDAQGSLVFEL